MNYHEFKLTVGGREVTIETGKYAEQTNGMCVVRCGETAVMVTVCMSATPREGIDFFPLQVDYEEKMFAVGKIPGGFKRREGRGERQGHFDGAPHRPSSSSPLPPRGFSTTWWSSPPRSPSSPTLRPSLLP